jgi:hypothetical protein
VAKDDSNRAQEARQYFPNVVLTRQANRRGAA